MSQEKWTEVDGFITTHLHGADPILDGAQAAAEAASLPPIAVSPTQGKMLSLLAQIAGARKILELGTLAGYSTIWLARALPKDGRVITLEVDPKHAAVARANFLRAGLDEAIDLRLGAALETLPKLLDESAGPFDMIFIDADKPNIPEYFRWVLKLARPGSVIVVDNVVRGGALADGASADANIQGVRQLHADLSKEKRVSATTLQTVGAKGYDGFTLIRVL